ncbi:outer membrane beta-barrel protein [Bacteroides sp. 519]|uniref:outer membrane beta-barrel protein n=1 Tax=Bacteroides sp. 519 TaxID=2302937 RepID=UPI0013CFAFF1|nr:outer membrane beta-barrel protein [Bacteroides sp. 519]NDV60752.1 porin family protein [Bacteroides sp. 519]
MKKIILLLFVVCAAMTVNAQLYVGGSLGFWNDDDADVTSYSIIPEVGYNLNQKWSIGAELGYTHLEASSEIDVFSIAPYARLSCYETGIVRLFLDGGFGFASYKLNDADSETGFEIGIKPGIAVKLNDKFSLVSKFGFLGYRDQYMTAAGKDAGNGFGLDFSPSSITFGLQVTF